MPKAQGPWISLVQGHFLQQWPTSAAFERLPFGVYAVVFLFAPPLSFHSTSDGSDP